jgi:hypothetical protein
LFVKRLSALVFNLWTGEVLMVKISSKKKKNRFGFPSQIIRTEDLSFGKEVWRSHVLAKIVSATGVADYDDIKKMVQPMPVCYHADGERPSIDCEGVIVGEIDFSSDNKEMFPVDPLELIEMAREGRISRSTFLLGLSAFASRECRNGEFREIAGRELENQH